MSVTFCSQEDVYTRAGGEAYLTQLLDPQRRGIYNQAMMNKAIIDASEKVAAYCQVQVDLAAYPQIPLPYPQMVVTLTADIAVYNVWRFGAQGRAIPEPVLLAYNEAIALLEKISRREVSIGVPTPYPPMNQVVQTVGFDDFRNENFRGRQTMRGFRVMFC